MNALGLYVPGTSVVHRAPPGLKLLVLVIAGVGSVLVDRPWQAGFLLALVALGYALAGFGPRTLLRQARPLFWLIAAIGVFHVLVAGWERAVVVLGTLVALILLAGLVTLTTRTTALVDTVARLLRPLRRFGVDPERVGLLLTLSIRSVFVVIGIAEEVRDAQRARGLAASPRAYAVPLLIRSFRHADDLAEALRARGIED